MDFRYDVSFGDPWLYISWELQRKEDEARDPRGEEARGGEESLSVRPQNDPLPVPKGTVLCDSSQSPQAVT